MPNKYLIPFALILMLLLAACGAQQTAETSTAADAGQPAANAEADDSMDEMDGEQDKAMAKDSSDEMDAMDDDAMDDDVAMDESQDGDMAQMDDGDDAMEKGDDSMAKMDDEHDGDMDDASMETEEMAMEGEEESMAESAAGMMELPLWQSLAVTNAATGAPFTLADFQGKTVFVEPMATWCSNCRTQQFEVQQAKAQLGDDVVFVGLSLETTLPAADLASYAQGNGFDWTYAVMSNELLAGLADEFGRSITSAPSTPHFIIHPDGSFSELSTGIHSAAEIIAQIQEAQS